MMIVCFSREIRKLSILFSALSGAMCLYIPFDIIVSFRVLIVDWDVHHGQGTQYLFYDDPRLVH